MAFKIKIISLLFIIVISFILLIHVAYGLKCKAGEGIAPMFTSGLASQCSGLSKITTEAECNATAEYNRKNNIDKNWGYLAQTRESYFPYGCFYYHNNYYWNYHTKFPKCKEKQGVKW